MIDFLEAAKEITLAIRTYTDELLGPDEPYNACIHGEAEEEKRIRNEFRAVIRKRSGAYEEEK